MVIYELTKGMSVQKLKKSMHWPTYLTVEACRDEVAMSEEAEKPTHKENRVWKSSNLEGKGGKYFWKRYNCLTGSNSAGDVMKS